MVDIPFNAGDTGAGSSSAPIHAFPSTWVAPLIFHPSLWFGVDHLVVNFKVFFSQHDT